VADPDVYNDTTSTTGGYYNSTSTGPLNYIYREEPEPEDKHADDRDNAEQANKMLSYLLDRKIAPQVVVQVRQRIIKQPKPRSEFVAWRYKR